MEDLCNKKNLLVRGGKSQQQRFLKALETSYVKVDERSIGDLLIYASKYARYLKYYNFEGETEGNWSAFFSDDISLLIAILANHDVDRYIEEFNTLMETAVAELRAVPNNPLPAENDFAAFVPGFKNLFDYILSLAYTLDVQISVLPEKTRLKTFAQETVKGGNSAAFRRLMGYFEAGLITKMIDPGTFQAPADTTTRIWPFEQLAQRGLTEYWVDTETGEWSEYQAPAIDGLDYVSVYGNKDDDQDVRLNQAFRPIQNIFDGLIKTFNKIVNEAPVYLDETVGEWPDHEPHMALYIAFLKLFGLAQQHLNGMTDRHLDYYFKEVLRLTEKAAEPDHVHLIIELAKHAAEYALKAGTTFKAGKDNDGKNVVYELTEETAFNTGQVAYLRSLYLDGTEFKLFTSEIANSADGLGAELETTDGQWPAFGPVQNYLDFIGKTSDELKTAFNNDEDKVAIVETAVTPDAIGFAIASPLLFLNEGTRTINITLTVFSTINLMDPVNKGLIHDQNTFLAAKLTGLEDWIDKALTTVKVMNATTIKITCILDGGDEAVIPYDPEIHFGTFNTKYPMIRILTTDVANNTSYQVWREIEVSSILLEVDVDEIKNLALHNDLGRLDPSKPFMPFGAQPQKGSALIIGSYEIFQKPVDYMKIKLIWDGKPDTSEAGSYYGASKVYHVDGEKLLKGKWSPQISNAELFGTKYADRQITVVTTDTIGDNNQNFGWQETEAFQFDENKAYSIQSKHGFIRLKLQEDFGHRDYIRGNTRALVESAKEKPDLSVLDPEFLRNKSTVLPGQVIAFSKMQTVSQTKALKSEQATSDAQKKVVDSEKKALAQSSQGFSEKEFEVLVSDLMGAISLLKEIFFPYPPYTPLLKEISVQYKASATISLTTNTEASYKANKGQFFHDGVFGNAEYHPFVQDDSSPKIFLFPQHRSEGELFIGISSLKPPQNLSVLFQVAEGSAEPLALPQDVIWSYLNENEWDDFADNEIADGTNGLLQSGIITFQVPRKADSDNTLLDSGHHWLRARVVKNSDAICKLIAVRAQAAKVTFKDAGNADNFLETTLGSETIAKLVVNNAAIKKIEQPYASFDGRVKEQPVDFYKRVSERLRHKARAITPWDYEHLVLEAFPDIYKVKCLNHTRIETDQDGRPVKDYEIAPGYVVVVTIPNLQNRNAVDPLKPFTSLGVLEEIRQYLSNLVSLHIEDKTKLQVHNPNFEEIQLNFFVRFRPGYDKSIYEKQLNQDILEYLSPWAYNPENQLDIEFGGSIHKSVLIDFIEELVYVDFISHVKMLQYPANSTDGDEVEKAVAKTSRSVLVSHPNHVINTNDPVCE